MKKKRMVEAQLLYEFLNSIQTGKAIPRTKYYVYVIVENGVVCYIGKGWKDRVLSHFKKSSNVLLSSKIKDNQNIYDWTVLKEFEEEIEALRYEYDLILECKKKGHDLYNKMHYSPQPRFNKEFKGIFELLKQYEERIFPDRMSLSASLIQIVDIVFNLIHEVCEKVSASKIPVYRNKPLNQLGYYLTKERGLNRVNIC